MKKIKKLFCAMLVGFLFNINAVNAEDIVAKVGDVEYTSLSDAVEAASSGDIKEVVLQMDINKSTTFTVDSGKEVIFNLNNHKITANTISNYVNNGVLTFKNGSLSMSYAGILNKENATMVLDNITYEYVVGAEIDNKGTMTIKNSTLKTDTMSTLLLNRENGIMQLDNVTATVGDLYKNTGKLTINSGNYTTTHNLMPNKNEGTLIINGGSFNNKVNLTILGNSTTTINGGTFVNGISYYETKNAKVIINNGTFSGAGGEAEGHLVESVLIDENTATLEINGGTFNYTGEDYVFDLTNVKTSIKGGSIIASKSNGINVSKSDLTIGTNEGTVSKDSPIISIPKGSIRSFETEDYTDLKFFDGSVTTKYNRIDINNFAGDIYEITLTKPTGYEVKYKTNEDNSYTAYLEKIKTSNDEANTNEKEENKDGTNTSEKEEVNNNEKEEIKTETTEKVETEVKEDTTTEKNPQTGIENIGLTILIVGMVSFIMYVVFKNKKLFVK